MTDPAALQVIILRDGLLVGTEAFVAGTFLVGSSPDSDLKLEDPTISGQHAILFFQNGRAAIQQSQGQVLVNGHPVRACEVRPVDEIAVGPFTLKLRMLAKRAQLQKPAPAAELAQVLGGGNPAAPKPAGAPGAGPQGRPAAPQYRVPQPHHAAAQRAAPAPVADPSEAAASRATMSPAAFGARPEAPTVPGIAPSVAPMVAPAAAPTSPLTPAQAAQTAVSRRVPQPAPAQPPVQAAPQRFTAPAPAAVPTSTVVFGQGATPSPQTAAPPPPPGEAFDPFSEPTVQGVGATVPYASAPSVPPVTVPSARRAGNAVVETPLPRHDSLELQIDSAPFPVPGPATTASGPRPFRVPTQGRRGAPRLHLELFWGDAQQASHCFRKSKKPFVVDEKQRAFALHGFSVPASFTLASSEGKAFRVSVPPGAKVERLRQDGHFTEARGNEVPRGTAASVTLGVGEAAQFVQGTMRLRAYVAPPPERFFGNPFKGMPWLALFFLLLSAGGFGYFLSRVPPEPELPDFNAQELAPVAVRLLKPKPKPKPKKKPEPMRAEKDKPKVEEKKVAEAKPKPRPVAKVTPKPQPKPEPPAAPEVKALKALAKLSAAGPAMHDMLAAVDKLGNGPGKKNAKSVSYKLSGLVGKAPIANAGLGHFGLGGGGKGGIGTLGAELLHGKGGGGIGAMGAGSVGRGKIGGRVSQAVARKIAASGNIDREAVARTVNQHLQEVRACYERQLLKDPGLAGKVVLEWTISTTGRVVQARTKTSSLHNASVESCILASLKGWHFPSARGGLVIVSYPFLFNAVGY